MAEVKVNPFAGYIFTAEELIRAATFNMEQRMYIQTVMSDCATEKINIEPTSMSLNKFLQQEAYLRGQIDILGYLLDAEPKQEVTAGHSPTAERAVTANGIDWSNWEHTEASSQHKQQ